MARAAFYSLVIFGIGLYGAISWQQWRDSMPATAQIHILDVSQGDAIHIRTASGDDILIDGGPDPLVVQRLGEVMPYWDRTIELMILTHPDADHVTGLISVFDYYRVEQVAYEPLPVRTATQEYFYQRVTEHNAPVVAFKFGDQVTLSNYETITILYPQVTTPLAELETNDTSITVLYTFAGQTTTRFLTMGDMGSEIEDQLAASGILPNIDILKVTHHGSKNSSSESFLQVVDPELALISVGRDNSYGHPHADTLGRLAPLAQVYRTDQVGTITVDIADDGYIVQQ